MKTYMMRADALTPELIAAWSAILRDVPGLDSPCFRPEFARAMQQASGNVEVGILEDAGEPVAFFPYCRGPGNVGRPVGRQISDSEGVVVRPTTAWDPLDLLQGCGLAAWHFNRAVAEQTPLQPFHCVRSSSSYIDLSEGAEAYFAAMNDSARRQLSDHRRHRRKAERELGPVRFVPQRDDYGLLRQLAAWKSEQCRRTGVADIFALPWILPFMERSLREGTTAFSGALSALYLGDRLASLDYSMRSYGVLTGTLIVYDTDLAKYGAGLMLVYELIESAPALGIRRIDLGTYTPPYKAKLASGVRTVAEGTVDRRPLGAAFYRGWLHTRDWLRRSRLRNLAHRVNRVMTSTRNWLGMRS